MPRKTLKQLQEEIIIREDLACKNIALTEAKDMYALCRERAVASASELAMANAKLAYALSKILEQLK